MTDSQDWTAVFSTFRGSTVQTISTDNYTSLVFETTEGVFAYRVDHPFVQGLRGIEVRVLGDWSGKFTDLLHGRTVTRYGHELTELGLYSPGVGIAVISLPADARVPVLVSGGGKRRLVEWAGVAWRKADANVRQ